MTFKKRLIVLVGAGGASGTVKTVLDGGVMTATINLHGLSGTGYELAVFSGGVAARYELFGDVTREKTLRLNGETDADNAHFAVYDGSGNAVAYGTRARERMKSLPVLPKKGERDATSESDKKAIAAAKEPFRYSTTENLFGDILSDEMAMICGSLGMLPSASLCQGAQDNGLFFGLYEPSGGSAPDIAGKGIANPIAQILSLSMLLRYSLGEKTAADAIDSAVRRVIDQGCRTGDLATGAPGEIRVNTAEMGDAIIAAL